MPRLVASTPRVQPAFHNAAWPSNLPNNRHLAGKVDYLRGNRFNVCPENSQSGASGAGGGGGYITEKLAQAHMAGTVPIYWGDDFEREVWSPARVIRFNGSVARTLAAVERLERDPRAASAFFAEPDVLPGATRWVSEWCDRLDRGQPRLARHARR